MDGTDTWEVRWQPEPPASGPSILRRVSRESFLLLDATGLLDSSYAFTASSLASFLSESMPLDSGDSIATGMDESLATIRGS